jgi:cell wall-associated NlpC family hydrolase
VVVAAGVGVVPLTSDPAQAAATGAGTAPTVATVHTDGQPLVTRTGPGRSFAGVTLLINRSTVTLQCGISGDAATGGHGRTTNWARTASGSFVSAAFLDPASAVARLSACPATADVANAPAATTAPRLARTATNLRASVAQAIAYATNRVGAVRDVGWCLKFVANAYGFDGAGFQSAWYNYTVFKRWHLVATAGTPPRGALVWYGPGPLGQGHVAISLGDGRIVSTTSNGRAVGIQPLSYRGDYKGWSYPNFPNGY